MREQLRTWASRVWAWARMRRVDAEFSEELESHRQMLAADNIRRGMAPDEARREAALRLGGVTQLREAHREHSGLPLVDRLGQDVRYAARMFAKSPGFTIFAGGALALGIAATTAVFSLADTVLLRPFPYGDPARLAMVWEDDTAYGFPRNNSSPSAFLQWKARNRVFDDMAALTHDAFNLTGTGNPERLAADTVTSNFFAVLGVRAALGRTFVASDGRPEAARTVVMSYRLWVGRFGADRQVIGRDLLLDGAACTVIGVMPRGFQFLDPAVDLWVPAQWTPAWVENRKSDHFLTIVARLRDGTSANAANAAMAVLGKELSTPQMSDLTAVVVPLREQVAGHVRPAVLVLLAAVAFVLLIACSNVANLLLVRGAARGREVAMRMALGASRARVVEQMLVESVMLSCGAGLVGLALSLLATRLLGVMIPPGISTAPEPVVNWTLLAFTATVSIATGVLFGMLPALRVSRVDLIRALKQGATQWSVGAGGQRLRHALVVAEVALALVLLAGAALALRSFDRLYSQDPGFRAERVLTLQTPLPRPKYQDMIRRSEFYREVLRRIENVPGVVAAGYTTYLPLADAGGGSLVTVENRSQDPDHFLIANVRVVSPGYFRAVGMMLRRGRLLDRRDGPDDAKVAVVNEAMARTYWPGEDAIGRRFKRGLLQAKTPWYTVVGIVGDMRQGGMDVPVRPEAYFPFEQVDFFAPDSLAVRTTADPLGVIDQVRRQIWAVDRDEPVAAVTPLQDLVDANVASARVRTFVLGGFAGLAMLLASLGMYGVLAFAVAQRTPEIGMRLALGARRTDVLRMIVGQGLKLFLFGAGLGIAGALALSRLMAHVLFGISPFDPLSHVSVVLLLAGITLLASVLPARRAMLVEPMAALREP